MPGQISSRGCEPRRHQGSEIAAVEQHGRHTSRRRRREIAGLVTDQQAEFPGSSGGAYALVPPGATLTSESQDGSPLDLTLSIDFSSTAGNVTAMGLVNVIGDRINPGEAEAHAIVTCASYVDSLPDQINQTQPSSAEFWNNFASTAECSQAFQTASDALKLSGETVATQDSEIADDAESITSDFFDDVLPKLISLAADAVFH